MTTRQILVDTKAKISSLETWTRGALARNESYGELDPDDPKATCWCVEGALILAASRVGAETHLAALVALTDACERLYAMSPASVNDDLGFEVIHRCLDVAIAGAGR